MQPKQQLSSVVVLKKALGPAIYACESVKEEVWHYHDVYVFVFIL
ncbi:MAG: hypothetical protein ACP5IM_01740 [Candidatus Bathyarchaeia archaeon]